MIIMAGDIVAVLYDGKNAMCKYDEEDISL